MCECPTTLTAHPPPGQTARPWTGAAVWSAARHQSLFEDDDEDEEELKRRTR
jgi:hypothetical protein